MIESSLYDFVHSGSLDKVREWLRTHPEDLNAEIGDGYTPLHVACLFGHETLVRFLLDRMALVNSNAKNTSGATPLHAAVSYRDEGVADRIARILIDNGAELNAKQRGGQTPLHHAVGRGSSRLVAMLIEAGADPFLKDDLGQTPSDIAKRLGPDLNGDFIQNELKKTFSLSTT